MFSGVRRAGAKIVVALVIGCALAAASASGARLERAGSRSTTTTSTTAPKNPTAAQIRAAVKKAEQSKQLWSTVNICNTKHHRDTIGIRGQMPSLSFPSSLYMQVQVDYWNYAAKKFEPDPGVNQLVTLGDPANQIVQGGATFKFKPPALLSGTITFEWKLHGKLIGSKRSPTGNGHKNAKFGDPAGYSSSECNIKQPSRTGAGRS
jgi:hypothetical protein